MHDLEALATSIGMQSVQVRVFPRRLGADGLPVPGEAPPGLESAARIVRSGTIDDEGEGAVVYTYNLKGELCGMFKYKNDAYAFDRRMRTKLTALSSRFDKAVKRGSIRDVGSDANVLKLTAKIINDMKSAAEKEFTMAPLDHTKSRISLLPDLVMILSRDADARARLKDSGFVNLLLEVSSMRHHPTTERGEDSDVTGRHAGSSNLIILKTIVSKLGDHSAVVEKIASAARSPHDLASEIASATLKCGASVVGIAAPPGSGKTAILSAMETILPHSKLFKLDAVEPAEHGSVRGSEVNAEIASHLSVPGQIALVDHCFDSTFAKQFHSNVCKDAAFLLVTCAELAVSAKTTARRPPSGLAAVFKLLCLSRVVARLHGVDAIPPLYTLPPAPPVIDHGEPIQNVLLNIARSTTDRAMLDAWPTGYHLSVTMFAPGSTDVPDATSSHGGASGMKRNIGPAVKVLRQLIKVAEALDC